MNKTEIQIEVTVKDIEKGRFKDLAFDPIGLALQRKLNIKENVRSRIAVFYNTIFIDGLGYRVPDDVNKWMIQWDDYYSQHLHVRAKPIKFIIKRDGDNETEHASN